MIPKINSIYFRAKNQKLITRINKFTDRHGKPDFVVYYRQQGKGSHKEKYMTRAEWDLWVKQGASTAE